jgi:hypothetical protein
MYKFVGKYRTERFVAVEREEFISRRELKDDLHATEALHKIICLLPEDANPFYMLLSALAFISRKLFVPRSNFLNVLISTILLLAERDCR